jgi:hypothetical protein
MERPDDEPRDLNTLHCIEDIHTEMTYQNIKWAVSSDGLRLDERNSPPGWGIDFIFRRSAFILTSF